MTRAPMEAKRTKILRIAVLISAEDLPKLKKLDAVIVGIEEATPSRWIRRWPDSPGLPLLSTIERHPKEAMHMWERAYWQREVMLPRRKRAEWKGKR